MSPAVANERVYCISHLKHGRASRRRYLDFSIDRVKRKFKSIVAV
jgi:hypothetical protein